MITQGLILNPLRSHLLTQLGIWIKFPQTEKLRNASINWVFMYSLLWIYRTLPQYTMEVTAGKSSLEFCVQGFWVSSRGWPQLEEKAICSLSGDQFGCVSVQFPSVRQWRRTQITLNKKNITYHHLTVKEKHYCVYPLLWSISMKSLVH